jgi:MoaA/NifB/PqqE/SkfB family radical SAM enzyme
MLPNVLVKAKVGAAMAGYNALYHLTGTRKPLTSQILITKFCNYDCDQCFLYPIDQKEKFRQHKEPTFEMLEYLIDESRKVGARVIVPFGGEPLIRKDIGPILKAIKDRNLYCVLYTNGYYVKDKIEEILLTDQLVISIDGDEETHDAIRGEGTYKKAIEAVEVALEYGMVVRLHTCLVDSTRNSLQHMAGLAKHYDVMLNYGYCDATGFRSAAKEEIELDRNLVIGFLKELREVKKSGEVKISSPLLSIEECIRVLEEWPVEGTILSKEDHGRFKDLKIPRCGLQSANMYIDSDGSVYPCLPLWGKEGKPGPNAYKIGLKKAWASYDCLSCHQCSSVFTIEKGFFYTFNMKMLFDYLQGFEFLRSRSVKN